MSTRLRWLLTAVALATYAIIPFAVDLAGHKVGMNLAFDLMVVVLLLISARLTIYLAGQTLVFFAPVALIAVFAGQYISNLWFEPGIASSAVEIVLGAASGLVIYWAFSTIAMAWRPAAVGALCLAAGALMLAFVSPLMPLSGQFDSGISRLWPSVFVTSIVLVCLAWFSTTAGAASLALARSDPTWSGTLALPVAELSKYAILASGAVAGLAAIPLGQSDLVDVPEHLLAVWIAIMATVILAGRESFADCLFLALPIVVLPMVFRVLLPDWPDLSPATTCLALIAAVLSYRGRQPGEAYSGGI